MRQTLLVAGIMIVWLIWGKNTFDRAAGTTGLIGTALNALVICRNGGLMPSRLGDGVRWVKISAATKLAFLGDIIPYRTWKEDGYMSIGDVFLYLTIASGMIGTVLYFLKLITSFHRTL